MKKYIVYLTTNTVNKKIYIGVHGTEDPDKFDGYLGCNCYSNQPHTYKYPKYPFQYAIKKYGPSKFVRQTLKVFDKLEDALDLERWLVCPEFIARKDTYNITLGGGIPPINTKQIYQYSLKGEFIKEYSSITEAALEFNCSSSSIGKAIFDRTPSLGFLWTDYKYEFIDIDNFKIDANKTKCYLYDINGNYLQEFKSIAECAKFINTTVSNLSNSIHGKYKVNNYYVSDIRMNHFNVPVNRYIEGFYKYDLEGNFIEYIPTYSDLVDNLKIKNPSCVYRALRTGNSAYGFQWSTEKLPKMKKLVVKTQARKVGKYTKDGELIQVFNTVREAKKDTCGAPNVLSGKRKTAGGYIWKYIDE